MPVTTNSTASNALGGTTRQVTAEIVRHGDKINVPQKIHLKDARDIIDRQMKYEEEMVAITETIDMTPADGALALRQAMEDIFGVAFLEGLPGMFGKGIATERQVENGVGTAIAVPWGTFPIPGGEASSEYLMTDVAPLEGRYVFSVQGRCRRKFERDVRRVIDQVRASAHESIYKGQAIRVRFKDDDGDPIRMLEPRFLDLSKVDIGQMIYPRALEEAIMVNLFTPIRHSQACRKAGIPLKRGVLAAGPFGTGKTLIAYSTAKVATQHDWTFLYLDDVRELAMALRFAKNYQPCVIFAEDVDRATEGSERTVEMDKILNMLDGVESKGMEVMTILTTNDLESINAAMLRPGRLDVVLHVTPPDAEAAGRLIHLYGRGKLTQGIDLSVVAGLVEGMTPAVIREVVERSKLGVIQRTGSPNGEITAQDLETSAYTVREQAALIAKRVTLTEAEQQSAALKLVGEALGASAGNALAPVVKAYVDGQASRLRTAIRVAEEGAVSRAEEIAQDKARDAYHEAESYTDSEMREHKDSDH